MSKHYSKRHRNPYSTAEVLKLRMRTLINFKCKICFFDEMMAESPAFTMYFNIVITISQNTNCMIVYKGIKSI